MRELDRERQAGRPKAPPDAGAAHSSELPGWFSAVGNRGVQQLARAATPDTGLPDDLRDMPVPGLPQSPDLEQGGPSGGGGEQPGPVELPAPQGADEWEEMPSGGGGEGWEEMEGQGGNAL